MLDHQGGDGVDQVVRVGEPGQEAAGGSLPGVVMSPGPPAAVAELGGRRLPEVMAEDGETDDEVGFVVVAGASGREGIEAVEGVGPDVALRVPHGILLDADHGLQLRPEAQPSDVLQETQAQRRGSAPQQQLGELLEDPFPGEMIGRQGPAQLHRLGRRLEPKPGDELRLPQVAEVVLGERFRRQRR